MGGAAKVGLLVLVFVGLLIGAYSLLGKSLFAPKPDHYYAEFSDVGGTTLGTPVLMAGVPIGTVDEVKLVSSRQARLRLAIDRGTPIPTGSQALLSTSLIGFSSNPVEIKTPEGETTGSLSPGATLEGVRAGPLDAIAPEGKDTIKELNRTLAAARKLLEDERFKTSFTKLVDKGSTTVEQFGDLAQESGTLLRQNRAQISGMIRSAGRALQEVQESTRLVRQMLDDPRYKRNLVGILESLRQTSGKADQLVASLNNLVTDPNLRQPANRIMANTEKITDSGAKIAASGEKIAGNTETITANGITITEEVIALTKKANLIADEAREALQRVRGLFEKTPGRGGVKFNEVGMDLLRETNPNYWRTDVNATLGVPGTGTNYHVGLFDAFESNRINLQLGRELGRGGEFRYGIYASKPGVGVDYPLGPRLELRGDLFNMNDPRLDLRLRYDFGGGIIGWAGVDRIFNGNSPVIGIGVRR